MPTYDHNELDLIPGDIYINEPKDESYVQFNCELEDNKSLVLN